MKRHPYSSLPERNFWRPAVAEKHFFELKDLWRPLPLGQDERVATAGSCFAQHIGRYLRMRDANYLDLEPAPRFMSAEEARKHGFGIYSCRYGNIYTVRQLRQLAEEAFSERKAEEGVWERNGRYFDALRPSVDPCGHDNADVIEELRARHLEKVRELIRSVDVFIFTLGLTEAWEHLDGTAYPMAPGTVAGEYDAARYRFRNYRHAEIREDLEAFRSRLKAANPGARLLLTVSPVPLTATASSDHVLSASTYSKSTLRSVAGEMAEDHDDVHYFPSYELISSHPARGMFFNPDLRTVNERGVDFVMSHFFADSIELKASSVEEGELICDEAKLDQYHQET